MRKEIFFAILAGGAFGLLIAFAAWKLNFSLKPKKTVNSVSVSATSGPENTYIPSGEFKVLLNKPENLSVSNSTPIELSGVTNPGSFVVISGEDSDTLLSASDNGSFTGNIELIGGANQLTATAFDNGGNETTASVIAIYSGQFETPSTGTGTSYIGTVTDITDAIIQLKDENGDIEQIKPTEAAVFVNNKNNSSKIIKASDIAIGDYLIAMGTKGANNIMDATRIVISDTLVKPTRRVVFGTVVDDVGYNKFTMKTTKGAETIVITPATGIQVTGRTGFGQIINDDKLIVVGEFKDGTIEARNISILK